MKSIVIGTSMTKSTTVQEQLLAKSVGSGTVAVYATPMMIALMESAAADCVATFLDEGETSVGTQISTTHQAATPIGMRVTATATITAVDGKKVSFTVEARDEQDVIGVATHERFIVAQERFEQRAAQKVLRS